MSEEATPATPARKRPSGLGRGLSALLGDIQQEAPVRGGDGTAANDAMPDGVRMLAVSHLRPLPNQPRKTFDEEAIDELAKSIEARGMLQPIVVREVNGSFEIVAGERRWRAAQRAQLHQVPVIIRQFDDKTALEIAIIENIQREQLNAWEEGEGYRRLVDEHGYTQDSLSKIVGKSRSHIANLMRLRNLPIAVHDWMRDGELSMGHARALLSAEDPVVLARQVVAKGLSVRDTEKLVRRLGKPARQGGSGGGGRAVHDADIVALERQLSELLGLRTDIKHQARSGTVTLHYSSLEQLDMLCQRLTGERI